MKKIDFLKIKVIDTYLEVLRSIHVSLLLLAEVEHAVKTLGAPYLTIWRNIS